MAYKPWELKVADSPDSGDLLALHLSVALGDELDTARFRLLSEQKDLFHEVDRLSAEGEFRLARAGKVRTPILEQLDAEAARDPGRGPELVRKESTGVIEAPADVANHAEPSPVGEPE